MRSGMQVHRVEWKFASEAQRHHHHPRYPKEQNVMSCPQKAGRKKGNIFGNQQHMAMGHNPSTLVNPTIAGVYI